MADRLDADPGLVAAGGWSGPRRRGRARRPAAAEPAAGRACPRPGAPLSAREQREQALLAMCIASPADGRDYLERLPSEHLSSRRRGAGPGRGCVSTWRIRGGPAARRRGAGRAVTQLVVRSEREPASAEAMELNFLQLEQAGWRKSRPPRRTGASRRSSCSTAARSSPIGSPSLERAPEGGADTTRSRSPSGPAGRIQAWIGGSAEGVPGAGTVARWEPQGEARVVHQLLAQEHCLQAKARTPLAEGCDFVPRDRQAGLTLSEIGPEFGGHVDRPVLAAPLWHTFTQVAGGVDHAPSPRTIRVVVQLARMDYVRVESSALQAMCGCRWRFRRRG